MEKNRLTDFFAILELENVPELHKKFLIPGFRGSKTVARARWVKNNKSSFKRVISVLNS